jgi:hypothetical protein
MPMMQPARSRRAPSVDSDSAADNIDCPMSSAESLPRREAAQCLNCGDSLTGAFCAACGQKAGGPPLHFHDFAHELVHELLHFDSKIWRSLKLLMLSPGTLTREIVAGRRVRYVGPIRLFLVASLIFFGVLALAANRVRISEEDHQRAVALAEADLAQREAQPEVSRFEQAKIRAARKWTRDPMLLLRTVIGALSKSVFLLVPIFAVVTWKLFSKQQPFYLAHLYFALHFHAFAFLLMSGVAALALVHGSLLTIAVVALGIATPAYFYMALRRALRSSWAKTVVAGSLVVVICSALNAAVLWAFLMATLLLA